MAYHKIKYYLLLFGLLQISLVQSQVGKFGFDQIISNGEVRSISTAIPNNDENKRLLEKEKITIKYSSENWIFFTADKNWILENARNKQINDFYLEYAPPALLDDTARSMHFVNSVHAGDSTLPDSYTGRNVIVGIVDNGIDHNHPDFISASGTKRLLSYWDHTISNPSNPPSPYNYGQLWTRNDIINGIITSGETTTGHGTTVSGIAVGNGLANGLNKGFAPEANIIAVKTDFNRPNWTLTIADACDYIFYVADSLQIPAVVNLSLGTYLGSHDAKDPAGEYIDLLLGAEKGRLVVCAAGNSGDEGKYHVHNDIDEDTSFVWFKNQASGSLGSNFVFFDLWADTSEASFSYSFGANLPSGTYDSRSSTIFRNIGTATSGLLRDTLFNENGDRLAVLEIYRSRVGPNMQMQGFIKEIDSTSYLYRFSTTGTGSYDLWSGTFLNLNEIVDEIPSPDDFPDIIHYVRPDSLQTIVSSWNCSERVISVGNIRGRLNYITRNGSVYTPSNTTVSGEIALSSSRGPTRRGIIKPDISAAGDLTLGAAPAFILNNPGNNSVHEGGFHMRNGGTSMASPVVAGAAALYLEKCRRSSWDEFKESLVESAYTDNFTGNAPNFSYGYGKLHALNLLQTTNKIIDIVGSQVICQGPTDITTDPQLTNYLWSTLETSSHIVISDTGNFYVEGIDGQGCRVFSDTIFIGEGDIPEKPEIFRIEGGFESSVGENYQWYKNDSPIPNAQNITYFPEENGFYSVSHTNEQGCSNFSNADSFSLNSEDFGVNDYKIYPNPVSTFMTIELGEATYYTLSIFDKLGRCIKQQQGVASIDQINMVQLDKGVYHLILEIDGIYYQHPFVKL